MPDTDPFAALRAKFDLMKRDALVTAERKALRATGEVIRTAISEVCPVHAGKPEGLLEPGQLRDSFRSYVRIASDERVAGGVEDIVVIQPSTQVCKDVAGWVERGHAGRTKDAKRTSPKPFIRPAQDAVEQKAVDTYRDVMTEEIKKVWNE